MPAVDTSPTAGSGPLHGLRVLVSGQDRAGLTTAALLADLGADAVVVEPPSGHPLRRALADDAGSSRLWAGAARNLRSAVIDPDTGEDELSRLLAAADLVVADPGTPYAALRPHVLPALGNEHARLIVLAVSPFGLHGPRAGDPGSDVVAEALAGLAHITGAPTRAPLHSDYPVGSAVTALFGAFSALAALHERDLAGTDQGCLIDLASADAVLRILDLVIAFHDQLGMVSERVNSTSDYQVPVNRWQTADGVWMSFTGNTNDVVLRFLRAIDQPALGDDPRFNTNQGRVENRDALEAIIADWFARHTFDEADAAMERERVPIASVMSMAEIFTHPQYAARGALAVVEDADLGPVRVPQAAMRLSRTPGSVAALGPALGADTEAVRAAWSPEPSERRPERTGAPLQPRRPAPLAGLRVLDIGNVIAGPLAATLLADLGAEVVKVERPGTGDMFRAQAPLHEGTSAWWRIMGRGKRSIVADLKDPADRDMFYGLVRAADVVIENFVPGVAAGLGVDHDSLVAINPRIVSVSISGYGQTGPLARRPAFGRNAEAFSGMAYMTGYPDDLPQHTGFPVADSFSALFAALGALATVRHRDTASGQGQHVDVALFESVFRFMEPQVLLYDREGVAWIRGRATAEPDTWRRVLPTADGAWVSVSVGPDTTLGDIAAWTGLSVDELIAGDPAIDKWAASFDAADLVASAVAAGVPAARAATVHDLLADPHLAARGMIADLEDQEIGTMRMPAVVPVIDGTRPTVAGPAPLLDQHRDEILAAWTAQTPEGADD